MASKIPLKISLIILAVAMTIAIITPATYAGMAISYFCEDPNCMEGTRIDYHVYLENTANLTLTFNKLTLQNRQFSIVVDFDVTPPVELNPRESYLYNFSREVRPLPDQSYTLTFRPCFEVKSEVQSGVMAIYQFCDDKDTNIPILPLSRMNCNASGDCLANEECFYFRCKNITCKVGEYAADHKCVPLQCAWHEKPKGNKCAVNTQKILTVLLAIVIIIILSIFSLRRQEQILGRQKK